MTSIQDEHTGSITGVVRPKTTRRRLLERAADTVDGDRDAEYGGPGNSFTMIAALWSAIRPETYTAADVALMMAALKIARLAASDGQHADSWVDLAGYAACGAEVTEHARQ